MKHTPHYAVAGKPTFARFTAGLLTRKSERSIEGASPMIQRLINICCDTVAVVACCHPQTGMAFKDMKTDPAILKTTITNGRNMMPKFKDKLSEKEIDAMVSFIKSKQHAAAR